MARPIPTPSEVRKDEEIREGIYRAASQAMRELTDGKGIPRISKELGRDIIEVITEIIFASALKEGYFRFPNGYGSLKVQRLKRNPQPKRLPTGEMVTMSSKRVRMRYEEGAAVRESLGMPPKTNYKRKYDRRSKLSERTLELLTGAV
jgi:hypothetical protein